MCYGAVIVGSGNRRSITAWFVAVTQAVFEVFMNC
jgi:hypothetical protein